MKKVISCLVAITLLLALTPLSFAESEWYKSDDGVLEVQVVSFEEKAYPQYTLQLCFRLDGSKVSDAWNCSFNLSSVISQYATNHPEMKNRKISITYEGEIKSFKFISGTNYEIILPVLVGKDKTVDLSIPMDAVTFFPNDFVNTDAMRIAGVLNDIKASFINPESFELLEAVIAEPFFAVHVAGSNKMGGKSTTWFAGKFSSETGEYYAVNTDDVGDDFGKLSLSVNDKIDIVRFQLYDLDKATPISTETIVSYMN